MDEITVIRKAQQGNIAAFNQLVMAYQGTAYGVAYRIMGAEDTAADACQDSFLKAFKALKQYRGGSFKSWLLRIVTNTCYDQLRYKKRRPATSLEDFDGDAEETHLRDAAQLPEDKVLQGELHDLIQVGLNNLPDDQRIVIVLSDIQGFAYQEIADIIGQPLGTVKSRLNRGRRRLRDFLLRQQELLPGQYRLKNRE